MTAERTVCVVDDDPGALRSMRWLLESEDLVVQTYPSAADFLAHDDLDRSACLVLDVRMPGMDGLELQQRLASARRCPPIIFLTGYGDVPTCAAALKQGAFDFLEKPVDDKALLRAVGKALEKSGRRGEQESITPQGASRLESLTPREREVVEWLYNGSTLKAIAARLGISFQTVAKHRSRALEKLGVANEAELVRLLLGDKSQKKLLSKSH